MARVFPERSVTAITNGTFTEAAVAFTIKSTSAAVSTPAAAWAGETVGEDVGTVVPAHPAAQIASRGAASTTESRSRFRQYLSRFVSDDFMPSEAPVGGDRSVSPKRDHFTSGIKAFSELRRMAETGEAGFFTAMNACGGGGPHGVAVKSLYRGDDRTNLTLPFATVEVQS